VPRTRLGSRAKCLNIFAHGLPIRVSNILVTTGGKVPAYQTYDPQEMGA
jgi:hypothetical protein